MRTLTTSGPIPIIRANPLLQLNRWRKANLFVLALLLILVYGISAGMLIPQAFALQAGWATADISELESISQMLLASKVVGIASLLLIPICIWSVRETSVMNLTRSWGLLAVSVAIYAFLIGFYRPF